MSDDKALAEGHDHAPGLWCDACPDAEQKRLDAVLDRHRFDRFIRTRDGHRECYCGHVLAEGERYVDHIAERLQADSLDAPAVPAPAVAEGTDAGECTCGEFAGTSVRYADCPVHNPTEGTDVEALHAAMRPLYEAIDQADAALEAIHSALPAILAQRATRGGQS